MELDGSAVTADYSQSLNGNMNAKDGNDDGSITASAATGPQSATGRVRLSGGVLVEAEFESGSTTASVTSSNGTVTGIDPLVAQTTDMANRTRIRTANPFMNGFEHQNYGTWVTGLNSGSGTIGAATAGLPATTTQTVDGTYNGNSLGLAVDSSGQLWETQSDVIVTTSQNFTKATVSSAATTGERLNGAPGTQALGDLDFTTPTPADITSNSFTATISGTEVSGTSHGTIYSDGAPEVGGTFTSSTADGDYLGSYGAQQ